MKRLLILALLPLLAACSMVGSEQPLFKASERAAWPLKPGVWALLDEERKCKKPADTRYARWPECAIPVLVRADKVFIPKGAAIDEDASLPYLLAGGDPMILQFTGPEDRAPDEPPYAYLAVRATKADGTEARVAFPECPRQDAPPTPGLKLTSKGCLASTASIVRQLAANPKNESAPAYWIGPER
jgi:hypothetical protein